MNRTLSTLAFLLGALVVAWVGVGYIGSPALALVMTVIIAGVYLFGAHELLEFRRATASLASALTAIPEPLAELDAWLERVHPSLQNPVRLRIEGERVGLPGPALTPYLVGLLVMLGMLGTFLGMVVTLNGAVFALEGTTDLQAIRSALAAPIRGLGVAFGTSVAGVAASAMLGLISALARRDRLLTAQRLDGKIASVLRVFSLPHQRQLAFTALQQQAQAWPAVVAQLQAMSSELARREERLHEDLLGNQERFHRATSVVYTTLAESVETSLKDSLTHSARVAGETLKPVLEAALAGIAREATLLQQKVTDATQAQLAGLTARFDDTSARVAQTWIAAQARHERSSEALSDGLGRALTDFNERFERGSAGLLASFGEAQASTQATQQAGDQQRLASWRQALEAIAATLGEQWRHSGEQTLAQQQAICTALAATARALGEQAQAQARMTQDESTRQLADAEQQRRAAQAAQAEWTRRQDERMDQLTRLWRDELAALKDQEARRGDAAVARLGDLQAALAAHLTTLGAALEAPMTRLIETASAAPRAAAEVIGQLRQEMSARGARDNQLLDERARLMSTLDTLLGTINHAAGEQRLAIDTLVSSAATLLDRAGSQLARQVESQTTRLADVAAHVTGSAVEVASLSEAFALSVQVFSEGNEKLVSHLQKIDAALDQSAQRSDEQLAYYVAQAREVIDLSVVSQKDVIDALRRLGGQPAARGDELR